MQPRQRFLRPRVPLFLLHQVRRPVLQQGYIPVEDTRRFERSQLKVNHIEQARDRAVLKWILERHRVELRLLKGST